ncbi:hypothetical protein ACFS3C_04305 [Azotobacter vinelandii]
MQGYGHARKELSAAGRTGGFFYYGHELRDNKADFNVAEYVVIEGEFDVDRFYQANKSVLADIETLSFVFFALMMAMVGSNTCRVQLSSSWLTCVVSQQVSRLL